MNKMNCRKRTYHSHRPGVSPEFPPGQSAYPLLRPHRYSALHVATDWTQSQELGNDPAPRAEFQGTWAASLAGVSHCDIAKRQYIPGDNPLQDVPPSISTWFTLSSGWTERDLHRMSVTVLIKGSLLQPAEGEKTSKGLTYELFKKALWLYHEPNRAIGSR